MSERRRTMLGCSSNACQTRASSLIFSARSAQLATEGNTPRFGLEKTKDERIRGIGAGVRIKEKAAPLGEFAKRQPIMVAEATPNYRATERKFLSV